MTIRVTIWNEYVHERRDEPVAKIYPDGIHGTIADGLRSLLGSAVSIQIATQDQPRHGLPAEVLANTDVLLWWGHVAQQDVADDVVSDVVERVRDGMGFIPLHSALKAKPFLRLMGTTGRINYRHDCRELIWTVNPRHPIAQGVPHPVVIPEQEMYGEFFDIPAPDELVFISSFTGGEVFRSGCCFVRGSGRIFYFSPGHETNPVYHQPEIKRILANAVLWAYQEHPAPRPRSGHAPAAWFE
jgi:trehalose utilization protein